MKSHLAFRRSHADAGLAFYFLAIFSHFAVEYLRYCHSFIPIIFHALLPAIRARRLACLLSFKSPIITAPPLRWFR